MKNSTFKLLATLALMLNFFTVNAQDWNVCWNGSQQFAVDTQEEVVGVPQPDGSTGSTYVWTLSGGGTIAPTTPGNKTTFTSNGTPGTFTLTTVETNDCGVGTTQDFEIAVVKPDVTDIDITGGSCSTDDITVVITGTPNATVNFTVSSGTPDVTPVLLDNIGMGTVVISNPAAGTFTFTVTEVSVSFLQPDGATNFACLNDSEIDFEIITTEVGLAPTTSPIIALP